MTSQDVNAPIDRENESQFFHSSWQAQRRELLDEIRSELRSDVEHHRLLVEAFDNASAYNAAKLTVAGEIKSDIVQWLRSRGWFVTVIVFVVTFVGGPFFIESIVQNRVFSEVLGEASETFSEIKNVQSDTRELISRLEVENSRAEAFYSDLDAAERIPRLEEQFNGTVSQTKDQVNRMNETINKLSSWIHFTRIESIHQRYRLLYEIFERNKEIITPFESISLDSFEENQKKIVVIALTRRPELTYDKRLARSESMMTNLAKRGFHSNVIVLGEKEEAGLFLDDDLKKAASLFGLDESTTISHCGALCIIKSAPSNVDKSIDEIKLNIKTVFPIQKINEQSKEFTSPEWVREVRDYSRSYPLTTILDMKSTAVVLVGASDP